ncbi:MAG: hypothetical protein IPM74_04080 [Crocinitomicaceae bacterium]|nr:hypothetical protein [Crocinitomicaceae bacterium]MBK8925086.1 hypothetical protein [Crocinitomicaceae bacterium]
MRVIQRPVEIDRSRGFTAQFIPDEYFYILNYEAYLVNFTLNINGSDVPFAFFQDKRSLIIKCTVSGINCMNTVGVSAFGKHITSIEYAEGFTLIGFEDGRILKVLGTGGTGQNMFNITASSGGFAVANTALQSYLVGSHKFQKKILDIVYIGGKTLVCFEAGKILKVNGTGGSGYNVFAITEFLNGFSSVPGYNYYSGYEKLDSDVTNITTVAAYTLIAFKDGRQIKIAGTGGTGANMFKIIKTNYGYSSVPWTYILWGSHKFNSYIIKSLVVGNNTFFCFADGRIMKILGAGGTGQNMFNITQTSNGFATYGPSTPYLLGSYKFPHNHFAFDMKYINGFTYVLINGDFILKILGTGGTGFNMFNIAYGLSTGYINNLYYNAGGGFPCYLFGGQRWTTNITYIHQLTQIDDWIIVCYCREDGMQFVTKLKSVVNGTSFVNMFGTHSATSGFSIGVMTSDGSSTSAFLCCT